LSFLAPAGPGCAGVRCRDSRAARANDESMTSPSTTIEFGPFQLETSVPSLRRGAKPVAIQPRPLAVLCYLATRPGVVVGHEELLRTLWAGTHVTRAVLKVAVRAIREALGESADSPGFLETVGREGYRFVGADAASATANSRKTPKPSAIMVGRDGDLAALRRELVEVIDGVPRIVFVAGEAGVGKSTLIDRFVEELEHAGGVRIARGQCLEQYGESEAYLPILEAVGRLVREDADGEFAQDLRRLAPTWAAQIPALAMPVVARDAVITIAPAQMLREMTDVLEVLTRSVPLVLVLEDLQWSDPSTVDLIGAIARRRASMRLMVIASLRPSDVLVAGHPVGALQQELLAKDLCSDRTLALLGVDDVVAYLEARFGIEATAEMRRLAAEIQLRTGGNALFLVNVVNDLVAREYFVQRDGRWHVEGSIAQATHRVPAGLRELIGRRLRHLTRETHRVLEAACVAGDEFAVASVAIALNADAEHVEDLCESLASQGLLIAETGIAEWPDGTISGRYRFLHALYRQALYEGIGASRRVRLHRAIGLGEESAFGDRSGQRAAQLAMHFTRGRDHARALEYHSLAGAAARDRHAAHEAVAHFTAALEALAEAPVQADRAQRELGLVVGRATLLMAIRGYAAPETEQDFARARALCDEVPATTSLFPVLRGLLSYHHVRAQFTEAQELGIALLRHAARHPGDREFGVQAHYGHGAVLFHVGALGSAREHLGIALRDYDPSTHALHAHGYGGYDPGVACAIWMALTLAYMGCLDDALKQERAGLARARALNDAFTLAWACHGAAVSRLHFGDWHGAQALAAEAVGLAEEHGFPYTFGMAAINQGWASIMLGQGANGIVTMRRGFAAVEATGAALMRPAYLRMLATADAIESGATAALRRIDEALAEVEHTGERVHEGGLLIDKSDLLATDAAAEECLHRALDLARAQGARLVELRAATALARRLLAQRRTNEARALVGAALEPFVDVRTPAPETTAARNFLAQLDR